MAESRDDEQLTRQRLAAVGVLGFLLITPPFLARFDEVSQVFGIPVLGAYLYLVWAIVIALVAVIGGRSE